ncbi:AraC family transcriptional regulator [Pueribacillus theae]|uniref:AraC family transcriptional regulator n=1 Tax=Pueribacillus theae TaxID=2171751 RepID=A0A2U1K5R3_9BACI|nr:helix-turn-helix domain-containing protein [Pueribacillus theae]PWA12857.1 AraC family transcriptional regulator [Pueribacillus theae]
MLLQTYIPQAPLSSFIDYFWLLEGYNPSHKRELALPNGSTELIIDLHNDTVQLFDRQNTRIILSSAIVCGPHSEHFIIDTANESTMIGVHFKPGGATPFFDMPINELHNSIVPLDRLWGARAKDLRDELLYSATTEHRFRILEKYFLAQNPLSWSWNPAVKFALTEFRNSPYIHSISDTVEQIGMSPKRFIQLFKEEVGMTPKRFCRLMRFQKVILAIGQGKRIEWMDVAIDSGYYDQAHFIKEFHAFSGLTPTNYRLIEGRHPNHVPLS